MVADVAGVVVDVVVGVAVATTEAINAAAIAAVVSVIIRAVVAVTYDSSPFTADCLKLLLSVTKESFAAIKSYYLENASV